MSYGTFPKGDNGEWRMEMGTRFSHETVVGQRDDATMTPSLSLIP
jgi:hypothetical protein